MFSKLVPWLALIYCGEHIHSHNEIQFFGLHLKSFSNLELFHVDDIVLVTAKMSGGQFFVSSGCTNETEAPTVEELSSSRWSFLSSSVEYSSFGRIRGNSPIFGQVQLQQ